MPHETPSQKDVVSRVMHEWKHGELESHGDKVKSRGQAIAIALSEAGESRDASPKQNAHALRHTKAKERAGQTARQQTEGRNTAGPPSKAPTRQALYAEAKRRNIAGRSRLSKTALQAALDR